MLKKILFFTLIFCCTTFNLFSDEWKICLGSFKVYSNAKSRVELLKEKGISTIIQEYQKNNEELFYRVFYEEALPTKEIATTRKSFLENHPAIKDLGINDIWFIKMPKDNSPVTKSTEQTNTTKNFVTEKNQNEVPPVEKLAIIQPEKRTITIVDSDLGNPIFDANVNIDNRWNIKSDKDGKVLLPNEIQDGEHKLIITKENDYVKTEQTFTITKGEINSIYQISIPKKENFERIKIVLDWAKKPYDLDAHILDENHHAFYTTMNHGNLELDRDDVSSYGPETVTIKHPDPKSVYKYYVFDYTDAENLYSTNLSYSEAQVKVYFDNEFKSSFQIKPNQEGITWYVFDIVNGYEIVTKDIVSSKKPSEY